MTCHLDCVTLHLHCSQEWLVHCKQFVAKHMAPRDLQKGEYSAKEFSSSLLYWYSGHFLHLIGQSEAMSSRGQLYQCSQPHQCRISAGPKYCESFGLHRCRSLFASFAPLLDGSVCSQLWLAGGCLALCFSWWIFLVLTWLYILCSPSCQQSWTGLSGKAF